MKYRARNKSIGKKIGNGCNLSPAKCSLYMDMCGVISFHIFRANSLYWLLRYLLDVTN